MRLIKDLGLIYATSTSKRKLRYGMYECPTCLKPYRILTSSVKNKHAIRCRGCSNKITKTTHGESHTVIYRKWGGMKNRCFNPKDPYYKDYGDRGITIYEPWIDDYIAYRDYIMSLPNAMKDKYTVDRINNDKNYEPKNLRWASQSTQAQNTRILNSTNTSGYRGVSWNKAAKKWISKIKINSKPIHLGRFVNKIDAAKAYNQYIIDNKLEHTLNIFEPMIMMHISNSVDNIKEPHE